MADAANHPAGWVGIGTDLQVFSVSGFLSKGEDHSRLINTFSLSWAPLRFLEAALAMHVTSDQSVEGDADELMVAVGDPEFSLKGGGAVGGGFAVGGLLDLRFLSGAGFFESSLSATSVLAAGLVSWSARSLPLAVHLNLGFLYDGSENLFDDLAALTPAQRYAAQISSFHRVVTRLGVSYDTRYLGPFVELSLEPFVGSGAPGFSDSPGVVSLGLKAWPTRSKGLQLLAALDLGITGVSDGEPPQLDAGKYAFVMPRWNLLFRVSYSFDAYAADTQPAPRPTVGDDDTHTTTAPVAPSTAPTGVIAGKVLDSASGAPLTEARLRVDGSDTSSLAVDPQNGAFRTYGLAPGKHVLVATAPGYSEMRIDVQVKADGTTDVPIRLAPKSAVTPGTLRGTISALVGKNPRKATILIPELDRTVGVDRSGTFSIQLKPGSYKLVVSARGFRTQTKRITVQEGSTVILNVELHR